MQPTAAGLCLLSQGRVLLLRRRAGCDAGGCWAFPGGKIEPSETALQAAIRELQEETGLTFSGPTISIGVARNGFEGFASLVSDPVDPALNFEHDAYMWAAFDDLPTPLHPVMVEQFLKWVDPLGWVKRFAQGLINPA